jgi:hypothetical protein
LSEIAHGADREIDGAIHRPDSRTPFARTSDVDNFLKTLRLDRRTVLRIGTTLLDGLDLLRNPALHASPLRPQLAFGCRTVTRPNRSELEDLIGD